MIKRFLLLLLLVGGALQSARADLSLYQFSTGTGTATDMSGATTIVGNGNDDVASSVQNIGFNFVFNGITYTQFSGSSNGAMALGGTAVSSTFGNSLTISLPMIAGFFDDMHTGVYDGNGYVKYKVTGSAPNRVLTVEWRVRAYGSNLGNSAEIYQWQNRLYEGSNKIEYLYLIMRSDYPTSASIGIAYSSAANDFISITPGTPVTFSRTTINNSANIGNSTNAFTANTMFTFAPCESNISISGNTAQGGTATMLDGAQLLVGQQVAVGEGRPFQPYTIRLGVSSAACASRTYTYTLGGAFPGDYTITPVSGVLNNAEANTPIITFTPKTIGERSATLTVRDDNGFVRTYTLRGEGVPRLKWSGDVTQGGTVNVIDGDNFLTNVAIPRNTTATYTPLTIRNVGTSTTASPAQITFTLTDPANQYSISQTAATLAAGQSVTPVITFRPTIPGPQSATLRVSGDGETRTYTLYGYAIAPAAEFRFGNVLTNSGTSLLARSNLCIGEIESVPVTITNVNRVDFVVNSVDLFTTQNQINQGTPRYPILKDEFGNRVRSVEYIITESPAVFPYSKNTSATLPIVVPAGASRTVYLNYIPNRTGSRYARLFLNTNGQNFTGNTIGSYDPGATPTKVEGVFDLDLFGKGRGSHVRGAVNGTLPTPVTFGSVDVRTRHVLSTYVSNDGECDLHITKDELRIITGDVNEFEIVSAMTNTPVVNGDYILAPGRGDSITIAFTPLTFGSRRASLRLSTNDSGLVFTGIAERGTYYIDLFGTGKVGLEAHDLSLTPAIVGAETGSGSMLVENTSGGTVTITKIEVLDESGEIIRDPAGLTLTFPYTLNPGTQLHLPILLQPATGSPAGPRQARVKITFNGGDTVVATVTGYAGTRTLMAGPANLFNNVTVKVGELARGYIAITNTGTVPVRLNDPQVAGANVPDYTIQVLPRRVIEPGATEFLEVTYAPKTVGTSSAQITFTSNATTAAPVVTLGGEATTATSLPNDPRGSGNANQATPGAELGRNNVATGSELLLSLGSVVPNPANGVVTFSYTLPTTTEATIGLYDSRGLLVRTIMVPTSAKGSLQIDTSDLPAGTYHCLLSQEGQQVTRSLVVVH